MPDPDVAQFTTVFRAGRANRIKRTRQPVSCMACQRRKSKCDKRQPCSSCEKRDDVNSCKYGSLVGKGASVAPGSKQEVQLRLSKLEDLVRGLSNASSRNHEQNTAGPASSIGSSSPVSATTGESNKDSSPSESTAQSYHGATSWNSLV